MQPQFGFVRLDPFRRAEEARLLAVPRCIDDCPLRLPALLPQLAERARLLQFGGHAADRILRAVDPAVVMVAADDPFVRESRPLNSRDDVVERLRVPVERDLEMYF